MSQKDPFVTTQGDLAGVFMGAALGRVVLEKVCSFSSELINYAIDWIISKHNVIHASSPSLHSIYMVVDH